MIEDDRSRRTLRLTQLPSFRALFIALAMVASALGVPIRMEPSPMGRVPTEVVRDEGHDAV